MFVGILIFIAGLAVALATSYVTLGWIVAAIGAGICVAFLLFYVFVVGIFFKTKRSMDRDFKRAGSNLRMRGWDDFDRF